MDFRQVLWLIGQGVDRSGAPVRPIDLAGDMRLHIDEAACIRSGVCATLAPHRFVLAGDRAVVLDREFGGAELAADDVQAVADAVACCPAAAITVEEPAVAAPTAGRP